MKLPGMLIVDERVYLPRRLSWRRLVLLLFAGLALVGVVNVLAWQYLKAYPVNRGISRVWQKWQLVERQQTPVDWLIFGDSTCGQGIMPSVIEEETGESALNLCTVANALVVNGAWQLERMIERVGPPKRAVFFQAYHVWERTPADLTTLLDQIPLERGFYRRMSPPLDLGAAGDLEIATRPLRTLFTQNLSLEFVVNQVLASVFTGRPFVPSDAIADLGFVIRNQGYVGSNQALPERVIAQSAGSAKAYATRDFVITPENEAALRALCAVSREHGGFPIYLANSSISRRLYQDPGFQIFYAKLVARLSAIVGECPTMRYVMQVPEQFDPWEMDNEDHVVTDTVAARLTRALVRAVEASPVGPGLPVSPAAPPAPARP